MIVVIICQVRGIVEQVIDVTLEIKLEYYNMIIEKIILFFLSFGFIRVLSSWIVLKFGLSVYDLSEKGC